MVIDKQAPNTENVTNKIPMSSLKVRNSIAFKSQLFLFVLDLYSGGHLSHFTASESIDIFKLHSRDNLRDTSTVLAGIRPNRNMMKAKEKARNPAVSLVLLLNSPSAQGMQSKQQIAFPLTKALRVPGRQLSLHIDRGTCTTITQDQSC